MFWWIWECQDQSWVKAQITPIHISISIRGVPAVKSLLLPSYNALATFRNFSRWLTWRSSLTHIFSTLPSAEIRIHGICIYPLLIDQDNKRPESSGKFEWTEIRTLIGKARNNIKNLSSAVFDQLSNNTSEEKFNFSVATMASGTKHIYFKWHKGRYGHKIIINITEDSRERTYRSKGHFSVASLRRSKWVLVGWWSGRINQISARSSCKQGNYHVGTGIGSLYLMTKLAYEDLHIIFAGSSTVFLVHIPSRLTTVKNLTKS